MVSSPSREREVQKPKPAARCSQVHLLQRCLRPLLTLTTFPLVVNVINGPQGTEAVGSAFV